MRNLIILFTLLSGLGTVAAQTKSTPQRAEKKELVKDTEPNIDATVLFIKTKLANSILWYTNKKGGVASDNCNKSYESLFSPSATAFVTNKFVFTTTCSYDPAVTATLTLFLDKTTSINMEGKGGLILMSDKSFFEVVRNGEKITPDLNSTIKILDISDNEKVLKAFKHLFKLLNIQLVDDMF